MLKRLTLAIVLAAGSLATFAQSNAKNKTDFQPRWYLQTQVGGAHTLGEACFTDLLSPAAALNIGHWCTPLWGFRLGVSSWQAKGAWTNPETIYKYNYFQGNLDLTLNLSNLLCCYNPDRVFNAYAFAGAGLNYAYNNDEAGALVAAGHHLRYYWDSHKFSPVGRFGLGADIKVSDRVSFNIEANANALSDKFNSKKAGNADWQFNALVGLSIKLGKARKAAPAPVVEEPAPAPAPAPAPVQKPVVVEKPAPAPAPVKIEPMKQNIFFAINSSVIRPSEQVKVNKLVAYLNEHKNAKVSIVGYADSKTGNATINHKLSDKRANSVKQALMKQGIAEQRITIDFKGDTVQPFQVNEDNRVCMCIAE